MNKKNSTRRILKLVCLCMAITFVVVATATMVGCSGDTAVKLSPDKPTAIKVWHYYTGAQKSSFDKMVSEFNETVGVSKGIIVEAFSQGNVNELTANILDSANKKVGSEPTPNIFAAYADTAYAIDKLGLAVALEDYMSESELSKYIPFYIDEGRMGEGNKAKIFPIAKSTEILMVNKTDFEPFAAETGAKYEDMKTFEGLAKTAKRYYEWSDGKALFGRDAMANYMLIGCKQLGVDIFTVKDNEVAFNLDETALKRIWDNYYVPFISGYFAANGKFRSDDAKVGDIISLIGSTTSATFFPTEVAKGTSAPYPVESVCLPAPVFEGSDPYAVQQGAGMVVAKATKEQEYASFVFLQWFTEPARNLEFSLGSCYLPVTVEANKPEVWKKALEGSNIKDAVVINTLTTAFEMLETNKLYTNQAFENGTAARAVLESSISAKAAEDRKEVDSQIEAGATEAAAVATLNTQENFLAWVSQLSDELVKSQTSK